MPIGLQFSSHSASSEMVQSIHSISINGSVRLEAIQNHTHLWYTLPKNRFCHGTLDYCIVRTAVLESRCYDPDNSVTVRKLDNQVFEHELKSFRHVIYQIWWGIVFCFVFYFLTVCVNDCPTTYLFITNAIPFIQSNAFVTGAIVCCRWSPASEKTIKQMKTKIKRQNSAQWIDPNIGE